MAAPEAYIPSTGYPIVVGFDLPERIARWRPLVHWLLVIPHLVVLYFLGIVAHVVVILAWFSGVIAGRIPEGLLEMLAMYQRYTLRVSSYYFFLRSEYPSFSLDGSLTDPGDDPHVRFDVEPRVEQRSRVTIFFRLLLVIPNVIVLAFVSIAASAVVFVAWFAVIILGRWPAGMRRFTSQGPGNVGFVQVRASMTA